MGSCCVGALCCAGSACTCACSACTSCCGVAKITYHRVAYTILQLVAVLVAFILMFTFKPAGAKCNDASGQSDQVAGTDGGTACFGASAVLRMTFALFIFHLAILLLILPKGTCASYIHDGGWCFKILAVFGLFIGFFFVHASVFKVWAEISRYVSILFLLFQSLFIIESAYMLSIYMIDRKTKNEADENWK